MIEGWPTPYQLCFTLLSKQIQIQKNKNAIASVWPILFYLTAHSYPYCIVFNRHRFSVLFNINQRLSTALLGTKSLASKTTYHFPLQNI